ncbi:unnamed protein product [Paramecium primaurelia]|uniref:Tetraspanin family protein n=2 Tax=Paramecium TaxID=5884 RepID=A0A8S1UK18_9CILI|nr:unnamed protein product [Paramecium primaurelia]CAD8164122.1 unnamed protein product [Paramecium pentaurelia]
MCLPLKFIQLFIRINCFCFIIFGIVLISQVFVTLNDDINNGKDGVVFTFSVGLAIIIVGASGLLSSYCPNFCIIFVYSCFIIFIGVLTIYVTICLTILQDQLMNKNFDDCISSSLPSAQKTKEQILWAETQFCKQNCLCYIEKIQDWDPDYLENNRISYTTNKQISDIIKYPDCNKSIKVDGVSYNQIATLEEKYSCSGWCKQHPVYLFSNINNGIPKDGCFTYFQQEYIYYVNRSYIDYLIVDILYIFNLGFAICQCYQTSRHKKSRIYPQILYELASQ